MLIHLAWFDAYPNTVIEALCYSILCSNLGGTKEIILSTNGGIISKCDEDVSLIDVNLENPAAPDLSALISDACRMIDDYKNIWEGIIKTIDINLVAKKYIEFQKCLAIVQTTLPK